MEHKLQELVNRLIRVATLRNLNDDNPIKITLENPNIHGSTVVIIAVYEPYVYPLPLNVTWICADANSRFYQLPLKRSSKTVSASTPEFKHTWTEVRSYADIFHPPQYYDDDDVTPEDVLLQQFLDHLRNKANPHETSASQVGALSINGGTMTGPLMLYRSPLNETEAAHKRYVDAGLTQLSVDLANVNNGLIVNTIKVETVESDIQSVSQALQQLQYLHNRTLGFSYIKTLPSRSWNIQHGLNSAFITVVVYDDTGNVILPDIIHKDNDNSLTINFLADTKGIAALTAILQ
jgi:hypothetical protein